MLTAYFLLIIKSFTFLSSETSGSSLRSTFAKQIPALSRITLHLDSPGILKVWHDGKTICSSTASEITVFECHCFPFISSKYKLFSNDIFVTNFSVTEPNITVAVPSSHEICENLYIKNFSWPCAKVQLSFLLQYQPKQILPHMKEHFEDIFTDFVYSTDTITIAKDAYSLPGAYQILLLTDGTLLKKSNLFEIEKRNEISLQLNQRSIFPQCKKALRVGWTTAKCAMPNLDFRLRIFAVPEGNAIERSYYLEEIHLDVNEEYALLPCSMFDIIYPRFCFELISVQKKTMIFFEWDRKCIQTENLSQVDGSWGGWSEWSGCLTSCGQGARRRFRFCNNPAPTRSGTFCVQDFVETRNCSVSCSGSVRKEVINDKQCECGCKIGQVKGSFFARICATAAEWVIHPRGLNGFLYLASGPTKNIFRLKVYRGADKTHVLYDSNNTTSVKTIVQMNAESLVLVQIVPVALTKLPSGVHISYEWFNDSIDNQVVRSPLILNDRQGILYENVYLLLAIAVALSVIVFAPPFLIVFAIKRKLSQAAKKKDISLLNQSNLEGDMIRSGNTESTVVAADKVVAKRSIGIQLSTTSTPRVSRQRRESSSRETSSVQQTPKLRHSSLSCFADHELEYDYYEPAIPGSFLTPVQDFHSEIDIDQIIGMSCLRDPETSKSDAHTQA